MANSITGSLDPNWPKGSVPAFFNKAQKAEYTAEIEDAEKHEDKQAVEDAITVITGEENKCSRCGTPMLAGDGDMCTICRAETAQVSGLSAKTNTDWQDIAKELGLEVFEQQPEETPLEWQIWTAYRNHYPGKLPTFTELAKEANCAVATVVKAAHKWDYKLRILAWAKHTDADIQDERIQAIKEMNAKQLELARIGMDKLLIAVNNLDPLTMPSREITPMLKAVTELQRTVTTYVPEKVQQTAVDPGTTKLGHVTKKDDMAEILEILVATGAMDKSILGIEQTTRVLVKGNDDEQDSL